jgi:hypothetical protein
VGFHFWFVNHSEKIVEDLISWQSNGKLKATIKKFRIDYIHNRINIKNLTIVNTDSAEQSTSYYFNAKDFHLKLRSRWDLLFHKQLLIDSIIFNNPTFEVMRKGNRVSDTTKQKLELTEELGNIYKTISQSLTVLNLQRFDVNDGNLIIKDEQKNKHPFLVSHIYFSIDELNVDSNSRKNRSNFIFSERVFLHVANQKILLPDNNSNIAFKDMIIDTKEKLIRVTAPDIRIKPNAQNENSLSFSADILNISGLDFNALYTDQLIKADSIFTKNPKGNLEIFSKENNKAAGKKKRQQDFNALKQLPVAVNINHIVMEHGNLVMRLHNSDKITSFQTKNDNLSVLGFRINDSLQNGLDIDGFNYTFRNYVGYTPDSIYRFHFDSLQFINNKILLYDFKISTVKKLQAGLIRDYYVPKLEITNMDWISFIVENHFRAKVALLYNPVLRLEKNDSVRHKITSQQTGKKSIYQILSVLDNLIDLDKLRISNARFELSQQKNNLDIQLQNLNLDIDINKLTAAKSTDQIVHSVFNLSFDTAEVSNASTIFNIVKASFNNQDKKLLIDHASLNNSGISGSLHQVALDDFSFDNDELEINGLTWKDGTISVNGGVGNAASSGNGKKMPALIINNISGNNTGFYFENKEVKTKLELKALSMKSLNKPTNQPFHIEGLSLSGNNASISFSNSELHFNSFLIQDKLISDINNIYFNKAIATDTIRVAIPQFRFIPFINETIESKIITGDSLSVLHPEIFVFSKGNINEQSSSSSSGLPFMDIKNVSIKNASVKFVQIHPHDKWNAVCNDFSFSVGKLAFQHEQNLLLSTTTFQSDDILLKKNDSISFKASDNIYVDIRKFIYNTQVSSWDLNVDKLNAGKINYSSKKSASENVSLDIDEFKSGNIFVTNNDTKNFFPWLINKSNANIVARKIQWQSNNTNLLINDFQLSQPEKRIAIQSFSIDPRQSKEDFVKKLVYRKDYMQAGSGNIVIEGIEVKDKALHIPLIKIDNGSLDIFSDKLKLAGAETTQPLPVAALKKLPVDMKIDAIQLHEMKVDYTELNADTKKTGRVYFTNINGNIRNVSSKPISDSLSVNVNAKFLDTMKLHLLMNESNTDALGGLELQIQLGRGDARLLNPFLVPLVSMKAQSGWIDTMTMIAYGNEYFSHGNMHLYYHDLKASLLDSGNVQQQKSKTKLLSFIANTFAIRNKNEKRQADFNFVRIREKSSISYFLTMVVQGAAKSVAPISKLIYRKEYKRATKSTDKKSGQYNNPENKNAPSE